MEGQGLRARPDEPGADLEARARAIVEPPSHLHRDRDGHRGGDRVDDPASAIGILEQGQVLFAGSIEEVQKKVRPGTRVSVRIREEPQSGRTHVEAMEILRGHPAVEALRPAERGFEVLLKPDCTDVSVISQDLSVRGFRIEHFAEQSVDLEEVFLHVTKGTVS